MAHPAPKSQRRQSSGWLLVSCEAPNPDKEWVPCHLWWMLTKFSILDEHSTVTCTEWNKRVLCFVIMPCSHTFCCHGDNGQLTVWCDHSGRPCDHSTLRHARIEAAMSCDSESHERMCQWGLSQVHSSSGGRPRVWSCVQTIDRVNNGRSSRGVTHLCVDCCCEALSFDFVSVLETEVTIFGGWSWVWIQMIVS